MVYLASSLALAALELLVHIDHERALASFVAVPVAFDEALVLAVDPLSVPGDFPAPGTIPLTQAIGDAWVERGASAILRAPSAVVAGEVNFLLNPKHPDAGRVERGEARPFTYDRRLFKKA